MWRNPLSGRRRPDPSRSDVALTADVWERAGQVATATLPVLAEVEAFALTIYGAHGLPTRQGHYRRGPSEGAWLFLGETLAAEQRWAMVLNMPPEEGWRYATLEDIGCFNGASAELRAASALLATCRHLKSRLTGREPGNVGDDIEVAIKLGSDWRTLKDALAARATSRLKLTTPADVVPDPLDKEAGLPAPAKVLPAVKKRSRRKPA